MKVVLHSTCIFNISVNPTNSLTEYITKAEVYSAMPAAQKNAAPRSDRIANTMIRSLGDYQMKKLTKYADERV